MCMSSDCTGVGMQWGIGVTRQRKVFLLPLLMPVNVCVYNMHVCVFRGGGVGAQTADAALLQVKYSQQLSD